MSIEVQAWLSQLGLDKYVALFEEQEIDVDAARDLTEEDLRELKIPMGPRKKILRAIHALTVRHHDL